MMQSLTSPSPTPDSTQTQRFTGTIDANTATYIGSINTIAPQAVVFLGANYQWEPSYFYSPLAFTLIGSSYIGDGSTLVPLGITSLSSGVVEVPIQAPGAIPSSLVGMETVFQAMVWDIQGSQYGAANWTNAQVVKL